MLSVSVLNVLQPTYKNLNNLCTCAMSDVTSTFRFPSELNSNLRKMAMNLVPYPRLKFLMMATSPIFTEILSVPEMWSQTFNQSNLLWYEVMDTFITWQFSDVNPQNGRYITASCLLRGYGNLPDITSSFNNTLQWIPGEDSTSYLTEFNFFQDGIKSTYIQVPRVNTQTNTLLLSNSTAIKGLFKRLRDQFIPLFQRKAYLLHYITPEMDELQLSEAGKSMLPTTFQHLQNLDSYIIDLLLSD